MRSSVLPKFEIDEKRKQFSSCQICEKGFSVFVREHQCKRCKRAVCDSCSQNKAIIIQYKDKTAHRVCKLCYEEIDFIQKFIQNNKLSFGIDSNLSRAYLEWLGIKKPFDMMLKEFNEVKQLVHQSSTNIDEYKKFQKIKGDALASLFPSLNYSLREFFHYSSDQKQEEQILQSVENVMNAILLTNKYFLYTPELMWITMLILCIASEAISVQIVNAILTDIIPLEISPYILKDSPFDFKQQGQRYSEAIETGYKLSQSDTHLVLKYIESNFLNFSYSLGINLFQFQTFYFIFELVIKKSNFDKFELALILSVCQNVEAIKQSKGIDKLMELEILRKQNAAMLYRKIQDVTQYGDIKWSKRRKSTIKNIEDEKSKKIKDSEEYKKLYQEQQEYIFMYKSLLKDSDDKDEIIKNQQSGQRERDEKLLALEKNLEDEQQKIFNLSLQLQYDKGSQLQKEIDELKLQHLEKDKQIKKMEDQVQDLKSQLIQIQTKQQIQNVGGNVNANMQGIQQQLIDQYQQISRLESENGKFKTQQQSILDENLKLKKELTNFQDKASRDIEQSRIYNFSKDEEINKLKDQLKQVETAKKDLSLKVESINLEKKQKLIDLETRAPAEQLLQEEGNLEEAFTLIEEFSQLQNEMNQEQSKKLQNMLDKMKNLYYEQQFKRSDNLIKRQVIVQLRDHLETLIEERDELCQQVQNHGDILSTRDLKIKQLEDENLKIKLTNQSLQEIQMTQNNQSNQGQRK